jgi:glc operon protein GlcG
MAKTHRFLSASAVLAFLVAWAPSGVFAQGGLGAQAASRIIDGCVAHAKGKGQSDAIAVYDDGGHAVALLRMDGNPPGVGDFAMQKAAAVAHWRFSTADMAEAAKETPGFANAPLVVTVAGGIPVYSSDGREFLGAVGVSGEAPQDDAACAAAGVQAAGLSLSRKPAS